MAVLVSSLISIMDRHTGDESVDRFSLTNKYDALTEACVWLQEEHQSELQNFTYTLGYLDTINYYTISASLSDILMASDLRKMEGENYAPFAFRDGKQLATDLSTGRVEDSYAIERHDAKAYLVINHASKYPAVIASQFESLTDGGTWTADSTTSDASGLALDTTGFIQGNGCLKFNATVSQSGNNRVSIYATDVNSLDLTSVQGLGSSLLEVYLPEVTYFSSVTVTWGTNTSNYWSATSTTPITGSAWTVGWNTVKIDWTGSTTQTGTPDVTDINYIRIDLNYTASQTNVNDYRVDYLRFARKENLTLNYLSLNVGNNTGGTALSSFSAGTDTPFYSGQYDSLKYATAHYAAGVLFQDNRLFKEADEQFKQAYARLRSVKDILPSSRQRVTKSFKPMGISFNKRK